jgi:hypothetical protein
MGFITPTPHTSCSPLERSGAKKNLHQKNTIDAKKFVWLPKFQVYSTLKLISLGKNC